MKKCIFCKKELEKKDVEHKEFGVVVGKFPARVCPGCGKVFYEADVVDKIQAKSEKKGLFGLSKKTKVAKVGNSLAVRIPKAVAEFTGLKKDTPVIVAPDGHHKIRIKA